MAPVYGIWQTMPSTLPPTGEHKGCSQSYPKESRLPLGLSLTVRNVALVNAGILTYPFRVTALVPILQ